MSVVRWFGVAAVVLLLAGAGLLLTGFAGDHPAARVLGILTVVLGLACTRVVTWARRGRALTRVGLDLAHGSRAPGGPPTVAESPKRAERHPPGDYDPADEPPDRA